MKPSQDSIKAFYQHLGGLLYAVSQIDGTTRSEEVDAVYNEVATLWESFPKDDNAYDSEAPSLIIAGFEKNRKLALGSEVNYSHFCSFKAAHSTLFTSILKEFIFRSALEITQAVAGNNKSELVFLSRLDFLLYPEKKLRL